MKRAVAFFLPLTMLTAGLIADPIFDDLDDDDELEFAAHAETKSIIAASSSSILADSEISDLKKRVSNLENAPNTLPPHPHAYNGYGLFFTGEALLWKVEEEGLDYAITGT